ncbi:MAG: hypothetical protein ACRCWW_04720 [Scandinavium sp.]|uniref:hypothetical protein n=1 Tax=Scandinavium sp. TaxID=2830653 RepID=UPI003F3041E0
MDTATTEKAESHNSLIEHPKAQGENLRRELPIKVTVIHEMKIDFDIFSALPAVKI